MTACEDEILAEENNNISSLKATLQFTHCSKLIHGH
jgi:hypothetical protein